jgi:hypothetical protein
VTHAPWDINQARITLVVKFVQQEHTLMMALGVINVLRLQCALLQEQRTPTSVSHVQQECLKGTTTHTNANAPMANMKTVTRARRLRVRNVLWARAQS